MNHHSLKSLLLGLLISLVATGCGGSSGSSTSPEVTIEWPAQTRAVQAPSYAHTAQISLVYESGHEPVVWSVSRPNDTGAQTRTYDGPSPAVEGNATLYVQFKATSDGRENVVAGASASVYVTSDGTLLNPSHNPLGTVTYSSNIKSLTFDPGSLTIGETKPITVSGYDGALLVALPQDLVDLQLMDGEGVAQVYNGMIYGQTDGLVTVRATFDSFTSDFKVKIYPPATSVRTIEFDATRITWDPVGKTIWGTFGANSLYSNSIVDLDTTSNQIGNPIAVGANPSCIAITNDGQYAYVGVDGDSEIKKVDLSNRTLLSTTIPIRFHNEHVRFTDIKVNPNDDSEFAVCVASTESSDTGGPFVFRNGIQVGSDPESYSSTKIAYVTPTTLIGTSNSNQYLYTVGSATISKELEKSNTVGWNHDLNVISNKAIMNQLMVDCTSLSDLDSLNVLADHPAFSTYDPTRAKVWCLSSEDFGTSGKYFVQTYYPGYGTPIAGAQVALSSTFDSLIDMKPYGNKGLCILTTSGLSILDSAPGE